MLRSSHIYLQAKWRYKTLSRSCLSISCTLRNFGYASE